MEFLKRIFTCKNTSKEEKKENAEEANKIESNREHTKQIIGIPNGLKKTKKKDLNELKFFMNFDVNEIKYTLEPAYRYIIPSDWFRRVKLFCDEKIESLIGLGISNSYYFDVKRRRIKPEIKNSQVCLVIYEIMNKLCEYFECDLIAKVALSKQSSLEDKDIEFFSKMPTVKRKKFDEDDDNGNDEGNLNLSNKIIYFPTEADNNKSKDAKENKEENEIRNKVVNSKNKDKDIIEHNYNKITPKEEEGKNSQLDENISFSDKKKSPISDKSTSKSSGNYSNKFNNEVLTKLSVFKKLDLSPRGLSNPSVYCFMNTCIQCLLSIPEFNLFFSEQMYKSESKNTKKNFTACNAIKDLIENYSNESDKYLKPPGSIYKVCHSFLEANTQHDCQEFLRRLLGKIQEELNFNKKYTIPDKISYIDYWRIYKENNPSFIDNMFAGLMRSSVICHKCKYQSNTYDPFLDISLPIERRTRSLMQCFDIYFAKEDIDCEYKCESCKKKTSITKKLEIVISPSILTLHIKRFEDFAHKYNGPIDFKYTIDITNYTSQEVTHSNKYELFAVAVHKGSTVFSGHYIAFGKRKNNWYVFNDSNSYSVSDEDDPSLYKDAYILFFRRID